MKISDIIKSGVVSISCEMFPPKAGIPLYDAEKAAEGIAEFTPSFISVTYGAAGTAQDNTVNIADFVQNKCGITALPHLTCVSGTKQNVKEFLDSIKKLRIENVLALRGDLPEGIDSPEYYRHASELAEDISAYGGFCIGGACYPEGHPESASIEADLEALKIKAESGCSFLTTQMFFDNNILYNFMFRLLKKGVDIPVVAGIMPVTNAAQIKRICKLSSATLPPRFRAVVDRFADNPAAMKQAGIAYATEQIIDLISNGVNNIHIYTMNKPDIVGSIINNLSEIRGK